MYWLVAGLFVLGAVCGATISLIVFVGVLLGGAAIAVAASVANGLGEAALNAVVTLITLQVGYVAGLVLRAAVRSQRTRTVEREQPLPAPLGEKRQ
jgi:ABC-type lipoprotein release transport system permease subunit